MYNLSTHATDRPLATSEQLPSLLPLRRAASQAALSEGLIREGREHETPENDRRGAGRRLAAGRLQQFTGAYLAEDVRAIGALTSPSTMFRKDYGRETQ
jgi:hypothetical protein